MKMGSCIVLNRYKTKPRADKATKQSKFVQIVGMDGRIIELKTPTIAGNFLEKYSGFSLSISPKSAQILPSSYELKRGSTYYLVRIPKPEEKPSVPKPEEKPSVKRIKVVITKQQLQELLAKQRSVEEVLLGLKVKSFCIAGNSTYSKNNTKLEPIPE